MNAAGLLFAPDSSQIIGVEERERGPRLLTSWWQPPVPGPSACALAWARGRPASV